MPITLDQILALVGKLDDALGDDAPRERFRKFLSDNVTEVGQIRDYIEECLRTPGDQYNRALQDLVNHLGCLLGFEVTYGRYQGVRGQNGYDGYWKSVNKDFHIVAEVKTTDAYAIKLSTVANYVDQLIEVKSIPEWDRAMGLFVIGRADTDLRQIEDGIIAQKRTHQFRIISIDSLLSLAELMSQYDINHDDILAVIRPSGPRIDPVIGLMARLVAEPKVEPQPALPVIPDFQSEILPVPPKHKPNGSPAYWLTPVRSDEEETAEQVIETLVGKERMYAFGERTPGRRHIKPGDWICFYATGTGVVAHAKVVSAPENKVHPIVRHADKYPWVFQLEKPKLYLDKPIVIDAELRAQLDAFSERDPNTSYWAWFVQATRAISEHDFRVVTGSQKRK